jgi:RNA polymerase sigma-70 factor (ECF subfamily)
MNVREHPIEKAGLPLYPELVPLADEALMAYLQSGHPDALAVLFDRYHRLVLSIALRILRDPAEAEDVMQSVFLEIFQSVAQFDASKGTTKIWILQYAYHRSFSRRRYLDLRGLSEYAGERLPPKTPADAMTVGAFVGLERAHLVQEALKHLSKTQRNTLELAFFEGLTMMEISQRTGESFDSVRHHYYRALRKLRLLLCDSSVSAAESSSPEGEVVHVQP